MSLSASVIEAMAAAGCSLEQIVATAKAHETDNAEKMAVRREQNRIRQQNHRARNAASRVTDVTDGDDPFPKKENPPAPPKEKTTLSQSLSDARAEFDQFWDIFPNKVGKRKAQIEFMLARRRDSLEAILAGTRRYAAKTDDRPWCNPATFLHQDRWGDMPAAVTPTHRSGAPPKPETVAEFFLSDARDKGFLDDPSSNQSERVATGFGSRQGAGAGLVIDASVAGRG